MKASLQLRIGQSLTMTPQLQQAIRLLQLSSIELQAEVQEALESNMMLEEDEGDAEQNASTENSSKNEELKTETDSSEQSEPAEQTPEMNQDTIPDELSVDSAWDDVYDSTPSFTKTGSDNNYDGFENQDSSEKTLREHLEWQLNLTPTSDADKVIAMNY